MSAKRKWAIGHREREFAREHGDPVLATVEAVTKEEAEAIGRRLGLHSPTGVWAWPVEL